MLKIVTNSMEQSPSWEIVIQVVKKFSTFYAPDSSLPFSIGPATDPYPEPHESSSHHPYLVL
jgi:hypothetical protein